MPEERPGDFAALPPQAQVLIFTTVFAGVAAATLATAANPGADGDRHPAGPAVVDAGPGQGHPDEHGA